MCVWALCRSREPRESGIWIRDRAVFKMCRIVTYLPHLTNPLTTSRDYTAPQIQIVNLRLLATKASRPREPYKSCRSSSQHRRTCPYCTFDLSVGHGTVAKSEQSTCELCHRLISQTDIEMSTNQGIKGGRHVLVSREDSTVHRLIAEFAEKHRHCAKKSRRDMCMCDSCLEEELDRVI